MTDRQWSGVSIIIGAASMFAVQWVLGWLWAAGPAWFGGHGEAVEIISPPIPSVSFALSGMIGGWVAAALAPTRPKTHACAAAALLSLVLLLWLARQVYLWHDATQLWLRFGLLWLGAWLGAAAQGWRRIPRLQPARR